MCALVLLLHCGWSFWILFSDKWTSYFCLYGPSRRLQVAIETHRVLCGNSSRKHYWRPSLNPHPRLLPLQSSLFFLPFLWHFAQAGRPHAIYVFPVQCGTTGPVSARCGPEWTLNKISGRKRALSVCVVLTSRNHWKQGLTVPVPKAFLSFLQN